MIQNDNQATNISKSVISCIARCEYVLNAVQPFCLFLKLIISLMLLIISQDLSVTSVPYCLNIHSNISLSLIEKMFDGL